MLTKAEFLTTCRFHLELQLDGSNAVDAIFSGCQGFTHSQDVIEACEVTPNRWGSASKGAVVSTKLPGNVKCGNLTLYRGMTFSSTFWNWFDAVQDGKWAKQRRNLSLTIKDQTQKAQARFELTAAWPAVYSISDVSAQSSEIEIEEIEVAFEGFKRVPI